MNGKLCQNNLVIRIQTICKRNFSIREIKILKAEIKKYKYKDVDYEKLLYYFPGKSLEMIKYLTKAIINEKKHKNLTNFNLDK